MPISDLFVEMPNVASTSGYNLSRNPDLWAEEITSKLRTQVPELGPFNVAVSFIKKDDATGAAVGNLMAIEESQQKRVFVPFIVRNFKLSPLDVMYVTDPATDEMKMAPLNADNVLIALEGGGAHKRLEEPMDYLQRMFTGQYGTNTTGMPMYSPKLASSSLLDTILPTIKTAQQEAFREGVIQCKNYLPGFEKHGQLYKLKAILTNQCTQTEKTAGDNMDMFSEDNLTYAKAVSPELIQMVSLNKTTRKVNLQQLAGDDFGNYASRFGDIDHPLREIARLGESIVRDTKHRPVNEANGLDLTVPRGRPTPTDLDRFANVMVQTRSGVLEKGILFPRICTMDLTPIPEKVFVGHHHSAISDKIIGEYISGDEKVLEIAARDGALGSGYVPCCDGHSIEDFPAGSFGMFVYVKDGKALGFLPMEILSAVQDERSYSPLLTVKDYYGNRMRLRISYNPVTATELNTSEKDRTNNLDGTPVRMGASTGLGKLITVVKVGDTYYIPESLKFIRLPPLTTLTQFFGSEKLAAMRTMRVSTSGGGYFSIAGHPDLEKTASDARFDANNLTATQLDWLLLGGGFPHEKLAELREKVLKVGSVPVSINKTASQQKTSDSPEDARKTAAMRLISSIQASAEDVIKVASYIDNSQVVDQVLSLNFISPDNIGLFLGYLPSLEDSSSKLAELTMASRLGMAEIPEQAASTAMKKISEVIVGLKQLQQGLMQTPHSAGLQ